MATIGHQRELSFASDVLLGTPAFYLMACGDARGCHSHAHEDTYSWRTGSTHTKYHIIFCREFAFEYQEEPMAKKCWELEQENGSGKWSLFRSKSQLVLLFFKIFNLNLFINIKKVFFFCLCQQLFPNSIFCANHSRSLILKRTQY
jgi:hypothetical protein